MTIFLLLFSCGLVALLAVLLHLERISALIFSALLGLLMVFDFSILSLDKIYGLHKEQDQYFLDRLQAYDAKFASQTRAFEQLTDIQLEMSLEVITQVSKHENDESIMKKIAWRDELMSHLKAANFPQDKILMAKEKIDSGVHKYLMEDLNQLVIKKIGHRNYSEFVRSRPRQEWTDALFIKELAVFLKKENIMHKEIELSLLRVKEFDTSGFLLQRK